MMRKTDRKGEEGCMERLCDVLEVRRGVTAVIGGGGKTSLLYRLASELRERDPAAGAPVRPP